MCLSRVSGCVQMSQLELDSDINYAIACTQQPKERLGVLLSDSDVTTKFSNVGDEPI